MPKTEQELKAIQEVFNDVEQKLGEVGVTGWYAVVELDTQEAFVWHDDDATTETLIKRTRYMNEVTNQIIEGQLETTNELTGPAQEVEIKNEPGATSTE